jgi:acetyl esterase/lipase
MKRRYRRLVFVLLAFLFTGMDLPLSAGPKASYPVDVQENIVFASVDGVDLMMDLYLPQGIEAPPLAMYIHGGGWHTGNRKHFGLRWLPAKGYAVASIEYRLSQTATFPAQIHDCKGALRWLRAHADRYGYNADRVVVVGQSAGGHLAALMGSSADVAELEGDTGGYPEQSSRVQGVIDYYGPTDFLLRSHRQPLKTEHPSGPVYKLLGGPVSDNKALARLASPVTHVGPGDPPLLMLHGDADPVVLPAQSKRLLKVYQEADLDAKLIFIPGKKHGWSGASETERAAILEFLKRVLPASCEN